MRLIVMLLPVVLALSCSRDNLVPPPFDPASNLVGTDPVTHAVVKQMEGIYNLGAGDGSLGTNFVCKVSKTKVSFFSNEEGIFFILKYGLNPQDSSLQFSGFWRYSEKPEQGLIRFSMAKGEGASDLVNQLPFSGLKMSGNFISEQGTPQSMQLNFVRPYSDYARTHEFAIMAHRGSPLSTAFPPFASNSLLGALYTEDYGVDGIEFDVYLTKDKIPICMHNPSIDILLTQKSPLFGKYSQYSFSFLQQYIKLVDGQTIPSIEQALTAVIDSSNMKYVWLDIKGDPDIFKYLEPVVRKAYDHARNQGRTIEIFAGLPSEEVIDEFLKWPAYKDLPAMCELSLQQAIDLGCKYFGPRFTLGLLEEDINTAHSLGMKVFCWTMNDKNLIRDYLRNGKFDGFLTDYPAYAVYDYYTMY